MPLSLSPHSWHFLCILCSVRCKSTMDDVGEGQELSRTASLTEHSETAKGFWLLSGSL